MECRRIELGSTIQRRNSQEYRKVPTIRWGDYLEQGDHASISVLCKRMNEDGYEGLVEVYRSGTVCWHPLPIERWLGGLPDRKEQPEYLKKGNTDG